MKDMCLTSGGLVPCSLELSVEQFTEMGYEKSAEDIVLLVFLFCEKKSKGRSELVKPE